MSGFFISATGTSVGKTLLTAALVHQLRAQGVTTQTLKPVITGFDMATAEQSDSGILLAAQGKILDIAALDAISPWRYAPPISPHLAAAEDEALTEEAIIQFCDAALRFKGITLIEGAGGIMSPLVQGFTQAQLVQRLGIPVVLVAGCYLGAISHTLTAAESLSAYGIPLHAIVVSDAPESTEPLADMAHSIASHLRVPCPVFTLPRISATTGAPWQSAPPITEILA